MQEAVKLSPGQEDCQNAYTALLVGAGSHLRKAVAARVE